MAEVVEVGLERSRHGGSMGNVEGQDGRSMRCCRPVGGGSGVAVGAASDRVATNSVSVEGLRGSCLRCRQFDEGGAGLGAVAIDVAVALAGLARAGPRDGVRFFWFLRNCIFGADPTILLDFTRIHSSTFSNGKK